MREIKIYKHPRGYKLGIYLRMREVISHQVPPTLVAGEAPSALV